MKNLFKTVYFIFVIIFQYPGLNAQNLPVQTQAGSDQCNNIRIYLMQEAERITDNALSGIHSLRDWQEVRSERYNELVEMLGLENVPLSGKRSDLHVKITGRIQKEGYHIEKLFYESLPSLYVPANLYIPDNTQKPGAAVLYVCGHSSTQKVHYQAHARKFAQLGFVCLIIETIQWGEVRGDHWGSYSRGWFNWYSRGYNPAGVEVWNAIRGLDLLADRPEVDPEKLGVTGISGGGSQSWYIAALDSRIKAVAPVCGASTLKSHILTRTIDGHCDCMMPVNTYQQDFQTIGALIAPKPLLMAQANRDGLNTIESVRELYSDIKRIYDLYKKPQNITLVETPGGHSYHRISREKIFSFFMKYLMGKQVSPEKAGDIDESPELQLSEDELKVYVNGVPEDDRTKIIQDTFVKLQTDPFISNETELFVFRDSVIDFLKRETFGAFPKTPESFAPGLVYRTADKAPYGEEIYSFISEKGWRLKVDIYWKNDPKRKNPLLIVLRNSNENRGDSEAFANSLNSDWNVAFLEVRGVGENGWAPELQWHIRRASAWTGRTIASMQVYDLKRCIEFCRTLKGIDPGKIGIAARDEMTVVAMYSALLDGNCQKLILKNPPESQDIPSRPDGRGPATEMLNCLRVTDVYQLPALLYPARVEFVDLKPGTYKWSEELLNRLNENKSVSHQ
jgi:dienelactone hydrolase